MAAHTVTTELLPAIWRKPELSFAAVADWLSRSCELLHDAFVEGQELGLAAERRFHMIVE